MKRWLRAAAVALMASSLFAAPARADEVQQEFWPEVDTWLRVSPGWRLSLFVPISKNIETSYREGNLIIQGDYAFGSDRLFKRRMLDQDKARAMKPFLFRGGYLGGRSLGDHGEAYNEETMLLELHLRTPIKGAFLLSSRFRSDFRFLGDNATFSTRLRYRIQLEKEWQAGPTSVVPYVNAEPYYDSRYETVNRLRLIGGGSVSWSARYALEGNFTYQHDSKMSPTVVHAVNIILHLFFVTPAGR